MSAAGVPCDPPDPAPADDPVPAQDAVPDGARVVLDAADVSRVLTRIAHEVIERNRGGDVVVLGLQTRGVAPARRIAELVGSLDGGRTVAFGTLDAALYRDDVRLRPARPLAATEVPAGGVDGRVVVLVDDVLYSGRTVRAALTALDDLGRPRAVQLAVLVDRGHRELPVRADFVGRNVPTSRTERVRVLSAATDGRDAVLLLPGAPGTADGGTPVRGELS